MAKIEAEGFKYHNPKTGKEAYKDASFRSSNINAAAKAIIGNSENKDEKNEEINVDGKNCV